MKVALINMIPATAQIEIEDIGYLFYHYYNQSPTMTPHQAARAWLERMNAVCEEEWGCGLDLNGILGIRQAKQEVTG